MKIIEAYILKIVFFAIIIGINSNVFSQINSTPERADSSDYTYKRKIMYLDINMKEENTMLSIGIYPASTISEKNGLNIKTFGMVSRFDQKFFRYISTYAEINAMFNYQKFGFETTESQYFLTSLNIGIRYFYTQKNNIKMNIAAANFNGPYVDLRLNNCFYYSASNSFYSSPPDFTINKKYKENSFKSQIFRSYTISSGYQQKLNNYILIDGSIFFNMAKNEYLDSFNNMQPKSYNEFSLGFSFKIGLGWGWL
jgi:hypothetical protein